VSAPFSSEQLLILDDLRHLLSGRSGSEAFEFLQHMVVDLMREVDSTNDEMDDQADKWKKRHESWLEQRREVADCVSAALREHVEDRGGPLPSGHVRAKKRLLHQLASSPPAASKASLSLSSKPIVDGTNLVVEHMAGQIKQLRIENEKLKERVAKQQSALDDLGGVAESRQVKIEALEQQFVALNDSRGSLARKLVDRTNEMIRLQFGSVPRLVSVRTAASSDGSVEVQQVDGEGEDGKEEGGAKSALGRRCAAALAAVDPDDSEDDEGGRAPTDEAGTEQGGDEEDGDGDEDDDDEEEDRQALLTHSLD
jgi:predicted  nucleic acid-binding Zn-ribbon protein